MNNRAYALDALRGYAIITMVLSATIVTQSTPRLDESCADAATRSYIQSFFARHYMGRPCFPFFLFAMGAAFPFSIGKRAEKGDSKLKLVYEAVKRGVQLTFFAIFIQHFYPYVLSSPQDIRAWLLAILCFAVLFPIFMRIPLKMPDWAHTGIKIAAYGIAVIMMLTTSYADGRTFSLYFSNVIILLLANMAIFGSALYIFTMHNRWLRLGVLLLLMAVILGSTVEGSWTQVIFNYTPLPWMYRFDYLKYLFIVIPGSIAGEYLMEWMKGRKDTEQPASPQYRKIGIALLILTMVIIVFNLYGLYTRMVTVNLLATLVLLLIGKLVSYVRQKESLCYGKSCLMPEHIFSFWGYVLNLFKKVSRKILPLLAISL
ncbi:DUF5009 domain-containing protein, partial [Bacteroides thetaiotaomicron]|uniref:DUF5009 domain-containing protein n=1 Tax=Bacteroides thetaiotaomicron TaxID=818 RepID=UPI00403FD5CF